MDVEIDAVDLESYHLSVNFCKVKVSITLISYKNFFVLHSSFGSAIMLSILTLACFREAVLGLRDIVVCLVLFLKQHIS